MTYKNVQILDEWIGKPENISTLRRFAEKLAPGYGNDVAHKAYLKTQMSFEKKPEDFLNDSPRKYLMQAVYTTALNGIRDQKREYGGQPLASLDDESLPPLSLAAHPQDNLDLKALCGIVMKELNSLRASDRSIFISVKVNGVSYESAALKYGIPPGRVKHILQRVKAQIATRVKSRIPNIGQLVNETLAA